MSEMIEKVGESPSPEEEGRQQEVLHQIDKTRKGLRDDTIPIAKVEKTAQEARLRLERTADELDRTYVNLSAIRGRPWPPGMDQHFRTLVNTIGASAEGLVEGYRKVFVFLQTEVGSPALPFAAVTACTGSTSAYLFAREHDPSLAPIPPGAQIVPPYIAEVATTEQKELRSKLETLAPHLVAKLDGAWDALASDNPDRVSQAATSMQELLDQVLHHFSDDPKKKDGRLAKALWWKANPRDSVTRPDRIRFVVQGYAKEVDPEKERFIQELTVQASALRSIQEVKHHHGPLEASSRFLTRELLANLEAFILALLRLYRPELHQPPNVTCPEERPSQS